MRYRGALQERRLDESSKAKLYALGQMALNRWAKSVGLQLFGEAYSPVQQYLADFRAVQALLHATTLDPRRTSNMVGQHTFRSTSQAAMPQPIPPPTGVMETGRLNPSTKLTS